MRKPASFLVLFGLCAIPAFAAVETYKDVSVVTSTAPRRWPTTRAPTHVLAR